MKSISFNPEASRSVVFNPSDTINAYVMTGASQAVTVPTYATIVSFSSTGNFYVKWTAGGTAAIPGANVTDGTASELNPTTRDLNGLASFAIIGAASVVVTVSYYNV